VNGVGLAVDLLAAQVSGFNPFLGVVPRTAGIATPTGVRLYFVRFYLYNKGKTERCYIWLENQESTTPALLTM